MRHCRRVQAQDGVVGCRLPRYQRHAGPRDHEALRGIRPAKVPQVQVEEDRRGGQKVDRLSGPARPEDEERQLRRRVLQEEHHCRW